MTNERKGERIAKRIARSGLCSRRDAEAFIESGRVRVNGTILKSPAFNVTSEDAIEVDGAPLPAAAKTALYLYHKPAGLVVTQRDPQGRPTIFDHLAGTHKKLLAVGRLDINTEGLLLLTNDGDLARMLELPSTGWIRKYRVRVHGRPQEKQLVRLEKGITVEGVRYGPIAAELERVQGTNAWLVLSLREGKNREVKRVLEALGLHVTRLIRTQYGPFALGELEKGEVHRIPPSVFADVLPKDIA